MLEPVGLSRDDGKWPDGITLIVSLLEKKDRRDVTCDDTLAESYLSKTSVTGRAAAELVCKWKQDRQTNIY